MEPVTVLVLFALAVAVVLLTSLIKNDVWSGVAKNGVATVLSVIAAAAGVWFGVGITFNPADLFVSITAIYGLSQLIYNFIINGTAPGQALDERLTAIGHGHDDT
jgi:hypothetical protein